MTKLGLHQVTYRNREANILFIWRIAECAHTGVPWIIIGICYIVCPVILLGIRYLLARENKRRDAEPADDAYDEVYIETTNAEGDKVERKVPKVREIARVLRFGVVLNDWGRNIWT